jgi:chromosome segregation ATPase
MNRFIGHQENTMNSSHVRKAEQAIQQAETDRNTLQAALQELQAQYAGVSARLDQASVAAELSPADSSEKEVNNLRRQKEQLEEQIRRKTLAIQAITTQLGDANQGLRAALHAAQSDELEVSIATDVETVKRLAKEWEDHAPILRKIESELAEAEARVNRNIVQLAAHHGDTSAVSRNSGQPQRGAFRSIEQALTWRRRALEGLNPEYVKWQPKSLTEALFKDVETFSIQKQARTGQDR